jgi:hypothetical protein
VIDAMGLLPEELARFRNGEEQPQRFHGPERQFYPTAGGSGGRV